MNRSHCLYTTLTKTVVWLALCISASLSCDRRHTGEGDTCGKSRLAALDDSIANFAESAMDSVAKGMAEAKDSVTYYEYYTRQVVFMAQKSTYKEAQAHFDRITQFVDRERAARRKKDDPAMEHRLNALLAKVLVSKAICNFHCHGDPQATLQHYMQAYLLMEQNGDMHSVPDLCANIADVFLQDNNIPECINWYRKALFVADSLRHPKERSATIYLGLAQVYLSLHDYKTAYGYYNELEDKLHNMTPAMQIYFLNNLGNYYYFTRQYDMSLKTFLRMKNYIESNKNPDDIDGYLCKTNLADVYLNLDSIDKAQQYADEVEKFFTNRADSVCIYYCHAIRIGIAARGGQTKDARHSIAATDMADNPNIPYNIVSIRNKYLQEYYNSTGNIRLAYECMKRHNAYTDSMEQYIYAMRAEDIMTRFTNDTLKLHHQLLMEHKNNDIKQANLTKTIAVTATIMAILVIMLMIMYARKKQTQARMDILNLKMDSIRNRISPHFMCNVINHSINRADTKAAEPLLKMAQLIRSNLEMSNMPCTTLKKEIDFVRQYVKMQDIMMDGQLNVDINIEQDMDTAKVYMPPMFIQILVENAICHGLKGLEGKKCLRINISRDTTHGDYATTIVEVTDNGRGFDMRRNARIGTGLGVISQTIAVTNERNKRKMRFDIRNTADKDGNCTGCTATITIPDGMVF